MVRKKYGGGNVMKYEDLQPYIDKRQALNQEGSERKCGGYKRPGLRIYFFLFPLTSSSFTSRTKTAVVKIRAVAVSQLNPCKTA